MVLAESSGNRSAASSGRLPLTMVANAGKIADGTIEVGIDWCRQ
jgi:hypothetical protein